MTTPVEVHMCCGEEVLVKRDDLYAPPPAPPLAKLRGVRAHLLAHEDEVRASRCVGVFDTRVSKAGWGTAAICKELLIPCVVFYPALKADKGKLPEFQRKASELGAGVVGMPGGRTGVVYGRSRAACKAEGGMMLPLGLIVPEAVESAENEARGLLKQYSLGTIVISVGTGTILSGILLAAAGWDVDIWGITAGMSPARIIKRVDRNVGERERARYRLHQAGEYYDPSTCGTCPFPAHPTYDLKAWEWLEANIQRLRPPVCFWNIGA